MRVGKSECISRGTLSSCSFQRTPRFFTLSVFRIFSSLCQASRRGLAPSVSQSAAGSQRAQLSKSTINPLSLDEAKNRIRSVEMVLLEGTLLRFNRYLVYYSLATA